MKRFIKFIFSFIMFNILLIAEIACIFGIVTVVKNVKTNKELDEVKNYFTEQQKYFALSEDDIVEHFKNKDSDITGMTQLDKIQAGLTPGDRSDSDGDGLTDKEEIEIYNTDPLKASTDGVTLDYFKVKSDTDIKPTYEVYDNFNLIDLNTGNNMLANIVKIDNCKIDGTDVIDTYAISDYDGTVEIDVSQYNDNVIFVIEYSSTEELKEVKRNNNKIKFDTNNDIVYVYAYERPKIMANAAFNMTDEMFDSSNNEILVAVPTIEYIFTQNFKIYVFEKSNSLFHNDEAQLEEYIKNRLLSELGDKIKQIEVHYTYSNELEYNAIKSILSPFKFVVTGDDDEDTINVIRALILFVADGRRSDLVSMVSSSISTEDETPVEFDETNNVERKRPSKYVTSFIPEIDEFPFMNIGTELSPGGNCSGIARITAKVFRGDEIEMELEENIDGTDYSYNLYGCDELETLQNKGLSDYKYMGYWEDTYGDTSYLPLYSYSDDDRTFIEYLGYNLHKENTQPDTTYINGEELTFEKFSKIFDWFENNDEILILSGTNINGGHTVNCYGIEQSDINPDIYYLLIYDNNAPCGEVLLNGNHYKADVECRAVVRHHLFKEDTVEIHFEFRIGYKTFYEYGTESKFIIPSNKDALFIVGSLYCWRAFTVRTVDGDIIF